MRNFLIVIGCLLLACLFFPMGWWILAFVIGFVVAVFELIFTGICSLFSSLGSMSGIFAGAGFWPIIALAGIILFIVCVIYLIFG